MYFVSCKNSSGFLVHIADDNGRLFGYQNKEEANKKAIEIKNKLECIVNKRYEEVPTFFGLSTKKIKYTIDHSLYNHYKLVLKTILVCRAIPYNTDTYNIPMD